MRAAQGREVGVAARRKRTSGTRRAGKPALRPYRLAPDVRPHEVDVHVSVDPQSGPDFAGEVVHRLRLDKRRRSLELDVELLSAPPVVGAIALARAVLS